MISLLGPDDLVGIGDVIRLGRFLIFIGLFLIPSLITYVLFLIKKIDKKNPLLNWKLYLLIILYLLISIYLAQIIVPGGPYPL